MAETTERGAGRAPAARRTPAAGRSRQAHRPCRVYRHPLPVRLAHWVNAACLAILLMSGLQIFNAHPALYWGKASDFEHPILRIGDAYERGRSIGVTTLFGRRFETTGVLGLSRIDGQSVPRAFPAWLTIPARQDLATGRVWHFFFAWVLVANALAYAVHAVFGARLARGLGGALRYNVIQKSSYLAVLAGVLPLAVLSGLTMSPGVDAAAPWLLDVLGGRQSARTIHFVVAWLLVAFAIVHVVMVLVSGFANNMRSMITGWYAPPAPADTGRGDRRGAAA